MPPARSRPADFRPLVCVVDFHHARGPEVERWFGVDLLDGENDPIIQNDWTLLPFFALADGAHAAAEEISYFTLRREGTAGRPASSLFGISCMRQMEARRLLVKNAAVTRSSVQKAIVAIVSDPMLFPRLREQISTVTKAWFAQRDFSDFALVQQFQDNLVHIASAFADDGEQYFGLSLREVIHRYKHQTLVLVKSALLQPKMLFYGSQSCEDVCKFQFSLISLIPGLLLQLHDCADPAFDTYEKTLVRPDSLRTSDRASLLSFMGLPLQIFGKGSFFSPYTPLQQLDILADKGTKSYVVGSTNALLLSQKERYSDILINLDDTSISISSPALKSAVALSAADRRFIDALSTTIAETWDPEDPTQPNTHAYAGSEDHIRQQFEEYLLALVSCVKYRSHLSAHPNDPLPDIPGDPSLDFGADFMTAWTKTENYRLFQRSTDSHLFDIIPPRHPSAGGNSIEEVQRRLASQVADLHLDEKLASSRDAIGKGFVNGRQKVSGAFTSFWAERRRQPTAPSTTNPPSPTEKSLPAPLIPTNITAAATAAATAASAAAASASAQASAAATAASAAAASASAQATATLTAAATSHAAQQAQATATATAQAATSRAGAYFSSWGSWAAEKRKGAWGGAAKSGDLPAAPAPAPPPPSKEEILWREDRAGAEDDEEDDDAARRAVRRSPRDDGEDGAVHDAHASAWNTRSRHDADADADADSFEDVDVHAPSPSAHAQASAPAGYDFDEHLVAPERAVWDD